MNTELIARLATEAGFRSETVTATNLGTGEQSLSRTFEIMSVAPEEVLAKFAALVAEECAKAADEERGTTYKPKEHEDNHRDWHTDGCNDCAATIRALFPPAP